MIEMDRWNAAEDRERLDRYQQEHRWEVRERWVDDRIEMILGDLRNDRADTPWNGPATMTQIPLRRDCAFWLLDEQRDDMVEKLQDGSEKGREFIWTAYAMARAESEAEDKDF